MGRTLLNKMVLSNSSIWYNWYLNSSLRKLKIHIENFSFSKFNKNYFNFNCET